jgi:hypothetical protein
MKTTCFLSYQDHCGEIIANKPCKYSGLLCTTVKFFFKKSKEVFLFAVWQRVFYRASLAKFSCMLLGREFAEGEIREEFWYAILSGIYVGNELFHGNVPACRGMESLLKNNSMELVRTAC